MGVGADQVVVAVDDLRMVKHGHKAAQCGAKQGDQQVGAQLEAVGFPLCPLLLDVGVIKRVIHDRSSHNEYSRTGPPSTPAG